MSRLFCRRTVRPWRTIALCAFAVAAVAAHARSLAPVDALAASAPQPASAKARVAPAGAITAHFEERLGVPTFLWLDRPAGVASAKAAPMPASAAETARAALRTRASLYNMSAAEMDAAPLHHVDTLPNGASLVRFTSQREGIEVFRESVTVLLGPAQQVVAIGGYLGPTAGPPMQQKAARSPFALAPEEAIARALADYGFDTSIAFELTGTLPRGAKAATADTGAYRYYRLAPGRTSSDGSFLAQPARMKPVWFRLPSGLVGAYYIEVEMADGGSRDTDFYAYVVAADDGRILYRHNQTADAAFTYRTYAETTGINLPLIGPQGRGGTPHPTGLNDGFQPPFLPQNDVTLQNGPISTNDPWLDPAATMTIGNNVEAWANHTGPPPPGPGIDPNDGTFNPDPNECSLVAPQVADFHACLSGPGSFQYTFDPTVGPETTKTQVMAAVVNLFYMNNWLHDWYYDAGFKEIDGNAQTNNFGRGGFGNDSIRAQGQDYSGLDNANMATPADGARPRMRMYVFTGTGAAELAALGVGPGQFAVGTAQFGPQAFDVTAFATVTNPTNGCSVAGQSNTVPQTGLATPVTGQVAVIDRGTCTFKEKVLNAQLSGAVAVIIANNAAGVISMGDVTLLNPAAITIPVLSVSQADGAIIKAPLIALPPQPTQVELRRIVGNDRDGTVDNSIIAHEWGHYISNRLIGDANGLTTNQSGGLGEGWADFHSLLMQVHEEDALVAADAGFNGTYTVGAYVSDGPQFPGITSSTAYYNGVRRYPYSSDLTKDPLSFRHIQTGVALPTSPPPAFTGDNAEVHNTGEVWASMLWSCYSNLLRDNGRLTFAVAQDRMKRYIVAAYKLTPVNPVLTEARDALFAAMAATDDADLAHCMAGFALRGAGLEAGFTGDRFGLTNAGVIEDTSTGNDLEITGVTLDAAGGTSCDADPYLDNGETGKLTVTVKNIGAGTLSATTVSLTGSPTLSFPSGASLPLAAIAPFASASVIFDVKLTGAAPVSTATIQAVASDPSVTVGPSVLSTTVPVQRDRVAASSATDDVEDAVSLWTPSLVGTADTTIAWRRVAVSEFDHHWTAPTGSVNGIAYLTSPPLTIAATGTFTMSFTYRHDFEFATPDNFDGGVIELSQDNGVTWTDIETVSGNVVYNGTITTNSDNPLGGRRAFVQQSAGYPSMTQRTITFPPALLGKTVRVRFGAATDSFGSFAGWDVDNIGFGALVNTPFSGFVADAQACTGLAATVGTPQSTTVSTPFATALQARVVNLGQPVAGVTVHFAAPASGASATFTGGLTTADVMTDVNGFAIAPALVANAIAGTYNVVASAGASNVSFQLTNVAAPPVDPPRLGAISTRMQVLTGDNVLIGGFIISGSTPKTVVVRARGPSLASAGIANFLANPLLQVVFGDDTVLTNDDWQSAANAAQITSSGFAPSDPNESAILVTLAPGPYTAIVSGVGGGTGVGIVEVFEVDHPEIPMAGISTRGFVSTGDSVMIGGIIIEGSAPQTVIVRARGPSLAAQGVASPLSNPLLQLVASDGTVLTNDDWQSAGNAAQITSSGFAPADPRESAILVTLNPGAYTAIVSGVGGATGVGIVEVFAVTP